VGLSKQKALSAAALPILVYAIPVLFFLLSLIISFLRALFFSGESLVFGDLASTVKAYETILEKRRAHLMLPAIFTFLGIAVFGYIAYYEFLR
jgi:hypothetical protein